MMAPPRTFTPQEILKRASDYGIVVSLSEGDNLALDIPLSLDQDKKTRALEVIRSHKPEIIAYLRTQDQHAAPITTSCSNHDQAVHVASTPVSPATLPLVTAGVVDTPEQKPEETRRNQKEIDPNTSTVELVASADAEKLEKTRKNSNFFDQDETPEHEAYEDPLNFCSVCGQVVKDFFEQSPGQYVAYCARHLPHKEDTPMNDQVVLEACRLFGAKVVEVIPDSDWPRRKEELLAAEREQLRREMIKPIERAPILKSLVNQWIKYGTALVDQDQGDFWAEAEKDLKAKGWYEAFDATNEKLLNRVETPRVYPCPVPRYELQEDEHGTVHLVTVGYWEASA